MKIEHGSVNQTKRRWKRNFRTLSYKMFKTNSGFQTRQVEPYLFHFFFIIICNKSIQEGTK